MVLSDKSIKDLVDKVNLIENYNELNLQPASYDLTVGTIEDKFEDTILKPGESRLISTKEWFNMPTDICAFTKTRSSFARKGIETGDFAGWIDPGFHGNITLRIFNFGDRDFDLSKIETFAQIIFLKTDRETDSYNGNYQQSSGIVKSVLENEDSIF